MRRPPTRSACPAGRLIVGGKEKFDARVAKVREGKKAAGPAAMATFERTRPTVGGVAVGVARGAYEYARDYACEREQFGRKIGKFQGSHSSWPT